MNAFIERVAALRVRKQSELEARHPHLRKPSSAKPTTVALHDPNAIVLGRNEQGSPLRLEERPRLEHFHVIGATGSGKTNFLEHMIRQDIVQGRGVCVVDPHGNHPGSLYRSLLTWIAQNGYSRTRTVHLIDPNALAYTVGFNPLERPDAETKHSVIAECTFEAFERMWGEDGNNKPTIQRVLTATFTALGEQGLTLAEARLLFDPDDVHGIRSMVLAKLQDTYAFDEIDWLDRIGNERTGRRDFRGEVVGPLNRLAKLVRTEAVRTIVGQTECGIDLREVLDDGHIILANLSGGSQVYEQGADLLGRLLTRFIFFNARRRRRPDVPFFLYLDECHRYLSGDLPNLLAEVRKYGLGLVLAHQWLAQLGKADDPIREAVCKGPNLRAIFRIKDSREAAELAELAVPLDLELPVQALIKPTVVGHRRTMFNNGSTAHHEAESWSEGETVADSVAETFTESVAHTVGESQTESDSASTSDTVGESSSGSSSLSEGVSQSVGSSVGSSSAISSSAGSATSQTTTTPWRLFEQAMPLTTTSGSDAGQATSLGSSQSSDRQSGRNAGSSAGQTNGKSKSRSTGSSQGTAVSQSSSSTYGESTSTTTGHSVARSTARGTMVGRSDSRGWSEGIEPVYANLPTAVHGKENVLYMAAQTLRSLTTGKAVINYVGADGMRVATVQVPKVKPATVSPKEFELLRDAVFAASPSALVAEVAVAHLQAREQGLISSAAKLNAPLPEPKTFRVPARKSATDSKASQVKGEKP